MPGQSGDPADSAAKGPKRVRLAYVVSHPIQYQAPLLRRVAQEPDIDLTVFFGSDFSVRSYRDWGFGVDVEWDVPLLHGYQYKVLPALRDNGTASVLSPITFGLGKMLRGTEQEPGFDVVWIHGYSTINSLSSLLAAKLAGVPVLLRAESWLSDRPRGRMKLLAKRLFFAALRHFVDAVLVIGTKNGEYWRHYLGDDFPAFLMPYSVDNAYFQSRSVAAGRQRESLRAELALAPERPVILFASKLQTRKHCDDLIAAYEELAADDGTEPDAYLLIVGEGEERAALERQAARTGFAGIRFCGFRNQSELPRFFDLCTVFVLPSEHEPWGLVVNEAMNAARAVIVSDDVGSQTDLITDKIEGRVFPVRDVDGLVCALKDVLASRGTATRMGQAALTRVSSWDFEADVRGLRQAIRHVTGGKLR